METSFKQIEIPLTDETPFAKEYDERYRGKTVPCLKAFRLLGAEVLLSISQNSLQFLMEHPFTVSCSLKHFDGGQSYDAIVGRGRSNIEALDDFLKKCFGRSGQLYSFGESSAGVYFFDPKTMIFIERTKVST